MKLKTLKRDRTRLLVKLLLPVCLMAFLPAGARAQAKLGIKGGIDVSEMTFSGDVFKKSNRMGFYVGPILKIPLFGLGFDIAALYTRRNGELKGSTEAGLDGKYKFTDKMIVVPIHARYGIDFGEGGIFAFAGPQFGFNVGKDEFKWTEKGSYESTFQLKKSNFSLNFGAGVMVADHLEVSVVYNVALGNTGELENTLEAMKQEKTDTKAKTLQISAALLF